MLTTGGARGSIGAVISYAVEGQVLVSSSSTLGTNATATITSVSPTGAVDGVNNGSANCADRDATITANETALTNAINATLQKHKDSTSLAKSLREVRDKKELEAYGMLQGSAFEKTEINKLQEAN